MIRPYEETDWPEICRVYDASKPQELRIDGAQPVFPPLATDELWRNNFRSNQVYVATDAGRITGFAGFTGPYIGWMFVDPAFFRRGIGRALLRRVLDEIDGDAWLWSLKGNERAASLYRSEGFEPIDERPATHGGVPCIAVIWQYTPKGL
jgi:GNAT superfamily N-acetyltransferase